MSSDAVIREYLERIMPLRDRADEIRDDVSEIKRGARADGLNLDAINALLPLLAKYSHDKAATVINELIRYAEAYGTEGLIAHGTATVEETSIKEPSIKEPVAERPPDSGTASPQAEPRRFATGGLRACTQISASIGVTFGLLWLLS